MKPPATCLPALFLLLATVAAPAAVSASPAAVSDPAAHIPANYPATTTPVATPAVTPAVAPAVAPGEIPGEPLPDVTAAAATAHEQPAPGSVIPETAAVRRTMRPPLRREHEIRLSAGCLPLLFNLDDWGNSDSYLPETFAGSKRYRSSTYTAGTYALTYSYRLSRRVDLTASIGYTHEYYRIYSNMDNTVTDKRHTDFFSLLPGIRVNWLRRRNVRLYSAFGLGATLLSGNGDYDYDGTVAARLTFLGVTFGNRLFGFAECGPSSLGSFAAGIGYRFDAKRNRR